MRNKPAAYWTCSVGAALDYPSWSGSLHRGQDPLISEVRGPTTHRPQGCDALELESPNMPCVSGMFPKVYRDSGAHRCCLNAYFGRLLM